MGKQTPNSKTERADAGLANDASQSQQQPTIRLIGTPAVFLANGSERALSATDAALVAAVLLDETLSSKGLAQLLWPDATIEYGLLSLRQRRFRLAKTGDQEVVARAPGDRLKLLIPVDLEQADSAWEANPASLKGELLAGLEFPENDRLAEWVERERQNWNDLRRQRLRAIADRHVKEDRLAEALSYRQRICNDDLEDETAHCELMRLHYLRADKRSAGLVFEELRKSLWIAGHQLPAAATTKLHEEIQGTDFGQREDDLPLGLLRPPRLVGRTRAMESLEFALAAGCPVVVLGEAGIGKTRLISEFATRSPATVVVGLRPTDRTIPMGALARLVREIRPRFSGTLAPEIARELARFVPEFGTSATGAPVVQIVSRAICKLIGLASIERVLLDDVQHADENSLLVLMDAAIAKADGPWWLLAARRDEAQPTLISWAEKADSTEAARLLRLGALSESECADFLELLKLPINDIGLWAAQLHRRCAGNPLFFLELLREAWNRGRMKSQDAASLPAPAQVSQLLTKRLTALKPAARELAQVAALADDCFDAELAAEVLNTRPLSLNEAWRELEQANVMQGPRFVHDLLRDALAETMIHEVRQSVHASIARTMEKRASVDAKRLSAIHWAAAGRWPEAAQAFRKAALDCRQKSQHAQESALWDQCIDAYQRSEDGMAVLDAKAESLESCLSCKGVDISLELANQLLQQTQLPKLRAAAALCRLKALLLGGAYQAGKDLAPEAVRLATEIGDEPKRFQALLFQAQAVGLTGKPLEGLALLKQNANAAELLATPSLHYEFVAAQGFLLRLASRHRESLAACDQGLMLAEKIGDAHEVLTMLNNRLVQLHPLGLAAAAYECGLRALSLQASLGNITSVSLGLLQVQTAVSAANMGHLAEAFSLHETGRRHFVGENTLAIQRASDFMLATLYTFCGQFPKALGLLGGDWSMATGLHRVGRLALMARMARWKGEVSTVWLEEASTLAVSTGLPAARFAVEVEASHHIQGLQIVSRLRRTVVELEDAEELALALWARSRLAERLLEVDRAAAHEEAIRCLTASENCCANDGRLSLWIDCAKVFSACADRENRRRTLNVAMGWIERAAKTLSPLLADSLRHRNPEVRALVQAAAEVAREG